MSKNRVQFGSLIAKENYDIDGIILLVEYLGKESKLTSAEKDLKKLALKKLKKLKKND
jgi:hypothetical protein